MCLILFAIAPVSTTGERFHLVVAANRDEFYARPSREAMFWPENDNVLAGKDLSAGGTWLGISRTGRFAAVTNFRETPPEPLPPRTRGDLTLEFLTTDIPVEKYLMEVRAHADQYRGFNLILGDPDGYYYYSNRLGSTDTIAPLEPGYYGLSNQLLNCDWPKVMNGKRNLSQKLTGADNSEALFDLLSDLGDGSPFSNSFIQTPEYGTCAKTVLEWRDNNHLTFEERTYGSNGVTLKTHRYQLSLGN